MSRVDEVAPPGAGAYRGRLAPTPSGFLHEGHAQTFGMAARRSREAGGTLALRNDDLDRARCRPEYVAAMLEDCRRMGLVWTEGPDCGGPYGPYAQSERLEFYAANFARLRTARLIYPSPHSRKDVRAALSAPQEGDGTGEVLFPRRLRAPADWVEPSDASPLNWRFAVPDGEVITFRDGRVGEVCFRAGEDFGDFLVWRKDGFPSYELATVVDDHSMAITEVVRGEDLLLSTARQILLYRALGWTPPAFFHCPLVRDAEGHRLAKRNRVERQEWAKVRDEG